MTSPNERTPTTAKPSGRAGGSPAERCTATLRVVSPCEHGVAHDILELSEGAVFSFPACKDSRGNPRYHVADETHYPQTVRRR